MKSVKVLDIASEMKVRLGFGLFNSIFDLLSHDMHESHEIYKRLIIQALQDYARYYPVQLLIRRINIERVLKFHDNFDAYLEGKIDEKFIQLLPRGIYWVRDFLGVNAQWWYYDKIKYELRSRYFLGVRNVSYFADYPYRINFAPDGRLSEDSKIYYLDLDEDQNFLIFLAYFILKYVRNLNTSINLNLPIQFLGNIDTLISETQEQYNDLIETRSAIYEMWRK